MFHQKQEMQIKDWRLRMLRSQQKAAEPLDDFQEAKPQAGESKEDVTNCKPESLFLSPWARTGPSQTAR